MTPKTMLSWAVLVLYVLHSSAEKPRPGDDDNIVLTRALSERQVRCDNSIDSFVQREKLCTLLHPFDASPRQRQSLSSCLNRCGQREEIGNFLKCTCDETCLAYKDCCIDMRIQCPDIYSRSRKKFRHLAQVESTCINSAFVLGDLRRATEELTPLQRMPSTSSFEYAQIDYLSLGNLFGRFDTVLVADTQLGVIYDSYKSSSLITVPRRRRAFVPRVLIVACMAPHLDQPPSRSFLSSLPYCTPTTRHDAWTVLHKPCATSRVVTCPCGGGHALWKDLRDQCRDRKSSSFLFHQLPSCNCEIDGSTNSGESVDTCTVEYSQIQPPRSNIADLEELEIAPMSEILSPNQTAMTITVVPVFLSGVNVSRPGASGNETGSTGHVDSLDIMSPGEDGVNPAQQFDFLVEFEGTPEKRIRCTNFSAPLTHCRVVECSHGKLLLNVSNYPWAYAGQTCVLPVVATAQGSGSQSEVSLCNCLRVAYALTNLKVWGVKFEDTGLNQCDLVLETRSQVQTTAPGLHDFSNPRQTPSVEPLSAQVVQARLQEEIATSEDTCVGETEDDLQVCFYSEILEPPGKQEPVLCVHLVLDTTESDGAAGNITRFHFLSFLVSLCIMLCLHYRVGQ